VPLIIPCHRVLAAGGRIGGFSAPGGAATKLRMLELEGVELERLRQVDGAPLLDWRPATPDARSARSDLEVLREGIGPSGPPERRPGPRRFALAARVGRAFPIPRAGADPR
jgi:hypothetical protein